jgi:hypothetical protein
MINTEKITINGKAYIRTWSDNNKMIERDGEQYEEAIDPVDSGRVYAETDIPIDADGEAEATEADYIAQLERFGV